MAFKHNTVQRLLFNTTSYKFNNYQTLRTCLMSSSSSSSVQSLMQPNPPGGPPEPEHESIFQLFFQQRPLYLSSTANLPEILRPGGEKLLERLKEMDIARNLVRRQTKSRLTVTDAKKILKASRIKMLKSKLRNNMKNHVSYDEFVNMCVDGCCDEHEGVELAKILENSGSVIVFGNVVFLKPEQILKAINELITVNDAPVKELEEMERWKSEIGDKARKIVRRELWGGLGFLVVQTAAFMRLTFWELSWDVMEPICFYVTSMYFMLGFAYFIRTSREPCFEAVFQSRFHVRQMKLMKMEGFDVGKYNELKKACGLNDQPCRREVNLQFDPSR